MATAHEWGFHSVQDMLDKLSIREVIEQMTFLSVKNEEEARAYESPPTPSLDQSGPVNRVRESSTPNAEPTAQAGENNHTFTMQWDE